MQRALISLFYSRLPLSILGCLIPLTAVAQITPDGTTSTTVNQNGNDFTIDQGDRVGDNLFHSFDEFSVPTSGEAFFNNASDIANIFSRVTGSNISNIDGLLRANGAANLFLINPNGIIFGENARLNLGGSFFASTADSLLFEGNTEFSASNPQAPPLLKVSIPIGLNFRDNPGDTVNRSVAQNSTGDIVGLEVAPGENLTLVGGNINFEAGNTTASGGNIELGGLSDAGTVTFNDDGSLNFPKDVAKADITLSNAADVDVRGTGGGSITINARNLNLEAGDLGSSLIRAGIIADSTSANAQAGDITINVTDKINVDESFIENQVNRDKVGNAGNVIINTGTLSLTKGGAVSADTFGQGNAGLVMISASDTITIDGEALDRTKSGAYSRVRSGAEGNAGAVTITTGSLSLMNGGQVDVRSSLSSTSSNAATQSETGKITLQLTEDLILRENGLISARAFLDANGGNIKINAEFIIAFPNENSDIIADAQRGKGGNINITTQAIFGLEERSSTPPNQTNDIDASSQLGFPGNIAVNTPEVDPTSGLIELPENVGDVSEQVAQNPCSQGVGNEFIITGKGGLRPNPHETLSSDRVQVALVEPVTSKQGDGEAGRQGERETGRWGDGEIGRQGDRETGSPEAPTPEAVPAQGWIFNDKGEVMLTSYVPSGMAEATPTTPVVQAQTNPSQLATQAEKLYQNQKFDEAATLWSQAAQAFAVSGDNLNQAMALSNLSLTYQQLGRWQEVNQAIEDSLTSLNAAPENSRLVAQTLDIQGKLQRETGQAAAAIDTWQKAANIYEKLEESAALTQNNLNQAQAFQDLGLYTRACQTILASLKMENIATCKDLDRLTPEELDIELDKITAQPSVAKILGLRKLGDLLLLIGQPEQSRQILATSLTLAEQLNSPSEIAATYLSIGKTYHSFTTKEAEPIRNKREDNREKALEAYRQAIASSPDLITQQQAKLNQLSLLLQLQQWSEAASLGQDILTQIANLPPNRSNIYAQINFAYGLIELLDRDKPQPPAEIKLPSVSEIDRILTTATENARILGDQRSEAYALGDRGRLYELTEQLLLAEQSTQQAISLISTLDSPDIAYQYSWQLGRIQNRQGDLEKAIAAYTKAYNALQFLRSDLATINPEVQFSFRDRVEPVYRELVALNFQYAQTLGNKANTKDNQEEITAKLIQARDVMESLQLAQLNNFFRQACIETNPQQIDKIDPNAAVIYTIVLPDKLGILLSLPNQPPKLYQLEVTQAEISAAVETMRNSLKSSSISVAETLPEYQKIYNWLISPLEAELKKNKVKTIAFVLDDDLRNIPMAVLHDGQQYLIEKYALAVTSGLQLLDPKPLTAIEVTVTAAGLSKTQDQSDLLPGVAAELQAMQEIGLTDNYLLNEEFTKQALKQNIVDSSSPIVHLATLAQFSPKAEDTFILAWDERININEFADLLRVSTFKRQNAIELLVLSAGETAAGDSRASLGLAGVALQAGVRSTLATVWPVVDESTAKIMEQFYLELKEVSITKVNKAEALRQAQLSLIKDKQFNHPHYWAPFILIGNWQ